MERAAKQRHCGFGGIANYWIDYFFHGFYLSGNHEYTL
jgi:hypothetical protein